MNSTRIVFGMIAICFSLLFAGSRYERMENEMRHVSAKKVYWRKKHAAKHLTQVQILSVNDFHGQITAGRTVGGRDVGSAPVLISYLKNERNTFDGETFFVHAGDLIGASVPQSALLQDEPSVMMFNSLVKKKHGLPVPKFSPFNNVIGCPGNHEFDEGLNELFRMLRGGNHEDGPFLQDPWKGAAFPHVCANITWKDNNLPVFAPYVVHKVKGAQIAFIGATVKETPSMVTPSGVADISFNDEADAVNLVVEKLLRKNIRAIVLLLHQGGYQDSYDGPTNPGANQVSGEVVDIVGRLHDEVDVVVSGHAHGFTNALLENDNGTPILVTQAWSKGTAYGDIELEIDQKSKDIVSKSAQIITTWADTGFKFEPDPEVREIVDEAEAQTATLVNKVIATAASDISSSQNSAGESALGNLIADAQRTAMGSDFAFTNPGGIREDCYAGEVTWGDLYTIQPFNNYLVKMELTGQQVYDLLNQQWAGQPYARILQISGCTYTWDNSRPEDDRIVEVLQNGSAIDPNAIYAVVVNSFLSDGGDNFTVLTNGANKEVGPVDLEAFIDYIEGLSQPFSAAVDGRIQRVN